MKKFLSVFLIAVSLFALVACKEETVEVPVAEFKEAANGSLYLIFDEAQELSSNNAPKDFELKTLKGDTLVSSTSLTAVNSETVESKSYAKTFKVGLTLGDNLTYDAELGFNNQNTEATIVVMNRSTLDVVASKTFKPAAEGVVTVTAKYDTEDEGFYLTLDASADKDATYTLEASSSSLTLVPGKTVFVADKVDSSRTFPTDAYTTLKIKKDNCFPVSIKRADFFKYDVTGIVGSGYYRLVTQAFGYPEVQRFVALTDEVDAEGYNLVFKRDVNTFRVGEIPAGVPATALEKNYYHESNEDLKAEEGYTLKAFKTPAYTCTIQYRIKDSKYWTEVKDANTWSEIDTSEWNYVFDFIDFCRLVDDPESTSVTGQFAAEMKINVLHGDEVAATYLIKLDGDPTQIKDPTPAE